MGWTAEESWFDFRQGHCIGKRLRLPDFCNFRHYEGGKVTHQPSLPPGVSWYSFLEAESSPGHMVPSVASEKIPSDNTGDRSRDPTTSSYATPGPPASAWTGFILPHDSDKLGAVANTVMKVTHNAGKSLAEELPRFTEKFSWCTRTF